MEWHQHPNLPEVLRGEYPKKPKGFVLYYSKRRIIEPDSKDIIADFSYVFCRFGNNDGEVYLARSKDEKRIGRILAEIGYDISNVGGRLEEVCGIGSNYLGFASTAKFKRAG